MLNQKELKLANMLKNSNYLDVIAACKLQIQLDELTPTMHFYFAVALTAVKQFSLALRHYAIAAAKHNMDPYFQYNLGLAKLGCLDFTGAQQCFEQAIAHKPEMSVAYQSLTTAALYANNLALAVRAGKAACMLAPNDAQSHWNYAIALLTADEYKIAWPHYHWGLQTSHRTTYDIKLTKLITKLPENHRQQHCVIAAEQGIGDQIMFAGLLHRSAQLFAKVTLIIHPLLENLFAASFPEIRVVSVHTWQTLQFSLQYDCSCYLGTLPLILQLNSSELISKTVSQNYIKPNDIYIDHWHQALSKYQNKYRIGLSWTGGREPKTTKTRSLEMQHLDFLIEQLESADNVIFNIQYDQPNLYHPKLINLAIDPMLDLQGFSGLLTQLDLIITVDNSTLHLAAAMGVNCIALLPAATDWRWSRKTNTSCWYPNLQIYRQSQTESWLDVIKNVQPCCG